MGAVAAGAQRLLRRTKTEQGELSDEPNDEQRNETLLLADRFVRYRFLEIIQRQAQAFFQLDLRLPAQQRAGFGDVGLALFGVVLGEGFVGDFAF